MFGNTHSQAVMVLAQLKTCSYDPPSAAVPLFVSFGVDLQLINNSHS